MSRKWNVIVERTERTSFVIETDDMRLRDIIALGTRDAMDKGKELPSSAVRHIGTEIRPWKVVGVEEIRTIDRCPHCDRNLSADDIAQGECPGCQYEFGGIHG